MFISRPFRVLAIAASVVTAGCSAPVSTTLIADDLTALSAADTICRVLPAPSKEASRDFVRMILFLTRDSPASGRAILMKLDSTNHVRDFSAGVSKESEHIMRMQVAAASFDATGNMSNARRRFLTKDTT